MSNLKPHYNAFGLPKEIEASWPALESKIVGRRLADTPEPPKNMAEIAKDVCERSGVTLADLRGSEAYGKSAKARQEFMWLAHATGRYSNGQIAAFVGRSDHTCVVYGRRAFERRGGQ